jgi:hypothetical protein
MSSEYIQNLRYKLQKRVRKLNSADYNLFHHYLKQFWNFLSQNTLFKEILKEIEDKYKECEKNAEKILEGKLSIEHEEGLQIGNSYFVIKSCVESEDRKKEIMICCPSLTTKFDESIDHFREMFLEPFYEYIDEQLDEQNLVLNFLLRYKKKTEWFTRKVLYEKMETEKNNGETRIEERVLSPDLYEYLFDQGIDFQIEPKIATGRPDLVIEEMKKELVADCKIYHEGSKVNISNGISQVYTYLQDTGKQFGYLIIFNPSEKTLIFDVKNQTQPLPHIKIGNKTIFLMIVDINLNKLTASKQKTKDIITISEKDLLKPTTDSPNTPS